VPSWADELQFETLMFAAPPIASASEVAMFHERTKTLLVTDSVTYISRNKEYCLAQYIYIYIHTYIYIYHTDTHRHIEIYIDRYIDI